MMVAKSGRTTGLTCAAVSAISVDVVVDYFTDCAETTRSMTKTFTNQIAVAGTNFSDAGDSGALVVNSANAEPVGLFFAGGTDTNGIEHAIANPVSDVLNTLDTQVSGVNGQTTYSFVGGADHPVSCLSYDGAKDNPKLSEDPLGRPAAALALPAEERERAEAALPMAQTLAQSMAQSLANPSGGIVRVGIAASKDHPGTGAVAFYVEPALYAAAAQAIPVSVAGVATVVLPANGPAGELATLPVISQPRPASLNQALAAKQKVAATLLKLNPAIFGVGVGQSLDNPSDAALILFVDRKKSAGNLPESMEGLRVRTILMDRLHVTRAHGTTPGSALGSATRSAGNCFSSRHLDSSAQEEPGPSDKQPTLLEDRLPLPN
jgi:hypothetical protein